jgi:ArsR family transcriptional regulator, arsenate/arsenite/antimonite-responsive transcriptional repressor
MEALFQALADATRLRILGLLAAGEVCVCDLHDALKISQPKASRHLAYLRRAGLVAARRDGQWMHYRLEPSADPLVEAIRQAVTRTLGHVESVKRDAKRLSKRTGCHIAVTCAYNPLRPGQSRAKGAPGEVEPHTS